MWWWGDWGGGWNGVLPWGCGFREVRLREKVQIGQIYKVLSVMEGFLEEAVNEIWE